MKGDSEAVTGLFDSTRRASGLAHRRNLLQWRDNDRNKARKYERLEKEFRPKILPDLSGQCPGGA